MTIRIPESLRGASFMDRNYADHMASLLPTTELQIEVNGEFPLIRPETLAELVAVMPSVLQTPRGEVVAVVGAGASLDRPHGTRLIADGPQSLRVVDGCSLWEAEAVAMRLRLRQLARSGVRLIGQGHWVGSRVEIASGCVLWPSVVLRGKTSLGPGVEVQPGAVVIDCDVAEGAVIKAYSVCESAEVGVDASVGPMAHLRTGTVLGEGVKIGNFVETKKAKLGDGAKASHLTYLGDAEVGAGANIGAGTITCNYDGFGKHVTEIGAGAFIGSNSSLVAPVSIGAGSIVGAGSVITKSVPVESLALERSDQRLLEGRAPRIRARNQRRAEAKKS